MKKAVFLDRDGVINHLIPLSNDSRNSPRNSDEFQLFPKAAKAIRGLKTAGWFVAIISNQPNVAKGKSSFSDIEAITNKMKSELARNGAVIDDIYYCFHHPDPLQVVNTSLLQNCDCRKPKPGLLFKAACDWKIDLSQSWMVGDSKSDIQAGVAAGCQTILVKEGLKYEDVHRLCRSC